MKPTLTAAEQSASYAKYFQEPVTSIPPEKAAILASGPLKPDQMLKITERVKLLEPGYFPVESGYGVQEDGTGYVCDLIQMPGVMPEMFEWWFAWYAMEDARYKIWDPTSHYAVRQQNETQAGNSRLPMRERTWGTVHEVRQDLGEGPETLLFDFKNPEEMGYPLEQIGNESCASMMCATIRGPELGQDKDAVMIHVVRKVDGGIEVRSAMWVGYQLMGSIPMKMIMRGSSVAPEKLQNIYKHHVREFARLAELLPRIYEEEKDNMF